MLRMDFFKAKAIGMEMKKRHPELKEITAKDVRSNYGRGEVSMKVKWEGVELHTGIYVTSLEREHMKDLSRQIEATKKFATDAKSGHQDWEEVSDMLKWRILSENTEDYFILNEKAIEAYAKTLHKITKGSWESLQALTLLKPNIEAYEKACFLTIYGEGENTLERDIRGRLARARFWDSVRPKTLKGRISSVLNSFLPPVFEDIEGRQT